MSKVPFIPFDKVKEAVTIEQVAEYLSLPLKKTKGSEYRCACPVHGGGDRSLVVNFAEKDKAGDDGCFYCFGEKGGGDRIGLLAHVRQIGQYAAVKELAERFAPHLLNQERIAPKEKEPSPAPISPEEKLPTRETDGEGGRGFRPLPYLQTEHEAVIAMGFPPEITSALGIGFSPRGVHRGRVALPMRLADGTLIGYISIEATTSVQLPPQWKL